MLNKKLFFRLSAALALMINLDLHLELHLNFFLSSPYNFFLFFISFLFSFFTSCLGQDLSNCWGRVLIKRFYNRAFSEIQILTHYFSKGWAFNLTTFCILNVSIHNNVRRQSSIFFLKVFIHKLIYFMPSLNIQEKKRYLPVHVVPFPVYPGLQVQL